VSVLIAIVNDEPDVVELGKAWRGVKNIGGVGYKLEE
jgi:hypothetical protein